MLTALKAFHGYDGSRSTHDLLTWLIRSEYEKRFLADQSANIIQKAVNIVKTKIPNAGVIDSRDIDAVSIESGSGNVRIKIRGESSARVFSAKAWGITFQP